MPVRAPVVVQAGNSKNLPLGETMGDMRTWLDSQRIEPVHFKTVAGRAGLKFEISFHLKREAERFRQRFVSLLA